MDFKQMHQLVSRIYPLSRYFRGIITDFHSSMLQGEVGFWICFIPSLPIGHYICIFEMHNGTPFIFDSFAEQALYNQTNQYAVQSDSSQNCGLFCLFFAFHALFIPPHTVINRYFSPTNFHYNEKVVKSWLIKALL